MHNIEYLAIKYKTVMVIQFPEKNETAVGCTNITQLKARRESFQNRMKVAVFSKNENLHEEFHMNIA